MGGRGSSFKTTKGKNYVKTIDMTDKNAVNLYCKQTLDKLAEVDDLEESYVILENGDVYHFKGPDRYFVHVPEKFLNSAKIDLHSHPHDEVRSFSDKDRSNWFVGTTHYLTDGKYDYFVYVKKEIPFDPEFYAKSLQFAYDSKILGKEEVQHIQCLYLQSEGYIDYEKMERHS